MRRKEFILHRISCHHISWLSRPSAGSCMVNIILVCLCYIALPFSCLLFSLASALPLAHMFSSCLLPPPSFPVCSLVLLSTNVVQCTKRYAKEVVEYQFTPRSQKPKIQPLDCGKRSWETNFATPTNSFKPSGNGTSKAKQRLDHWRIKGLLKDLLRNLHIDNLPLCARKWVPGTSTF